MNLTHFHPDGNYTMKYAPLELPGVFSRNFALCRVRVTLSGIFAVISAANFSPLLLTGYF